MAQQQYDLGDSKPVLALEDTDTIVVIRPDGVSPPLLTTYGALKQQLALQIAALIGSGEVTPPITVAQAILDSNNAALIDDAGNKLVAN